MEQHQQQLAHVVELWRTSQNVVALTGAGISVASGIPDFRSPGGLWSEFEPLEYATLEAFIAQPAQVWQMFRAVSKLVRAASPNPAHEALAKLEQAGRLSALITQNIDGLHQLAGSKNVIELHGTGRVLACRGCDYQQPTPPAGLPVEPVSCPLLSELPERHHVFKYLKPDVVLFGEDLKREVFQQFIRWQNNLDLLVIIGTSADVYPAAALPSAVAALGGKIIEINTEPTRISKLATCQLRGKAEELLPALAAQLLA